MGNMGKQSFSKVVGPRTLAAKVNVTKGPSKDSVRAPFKKGGSK